MPSTLAERLDVGELAPLLASFFTTREPYATGDRLSDAGSEYDRGADDASYRFERPSLGAFSRDASR